MARSVYLDTNLLQTRLRKLSITFPLLQLYSRSCFYMYVGFIHILDSFLTYFHIYLTSPRAVTRVTLG